MDKKIGRNDPCPCGSGKKYKACCMQKEAAKYVGGKRKLTAKWINAPQGPNLIERTFGGAISSFDKTFTPPPEEEKTSDKESAKD